MINAPPEIACSFAFENKEDIPKILRDSPWSVMGYYVALVPWDSNKTLNELDFNRGEFWIQVHDLPLGMLSSKYATELAKSLGKLIELDCVRKGPQTKLDFLRFRVEIDISKPLVPGFFIKRLVGMESWVSLKYEHLSDFCYRCGCLGHGSDSCTNKVITKYAGKWSLEMRAKMVRRLQTPSHHSNIPRFSQHLVSTIPHLHHKSTDAVVVRLLHEVLQLPSTGDTIGGAYVCQAVWYFFEVGSMPPEFNKTLVVLILKTPAPETITQFCPISLCNFIYKIISKVLSNRLKPLMSKIIYPRQSAFIPGRQIQDSIVVANEAFHYIRNKKHGEQSVMALEVDLNKAFDRVEWDFLFVVLSKMGFGDVWCDWIRACLTTYELEFMVNGDSVGVIKPQRGLRQGDPISPYLFIIVADVLSRQILKAMSLGTLSCIKMAHNCPFISHIFFADGSLFFLKASHVECTALVSILNSYCAASGQTVNFQKSSTFFSPNTPCLLHDDICSALYVQQMDSKAKYLGLPSIFGQKKTEMFSFLLDKVLQKMQGWKKKLLSQEGREVLFKSLIQAIPTYAMQCFRLPTSLLNKLMVYVRRFFWGGFWDFEAFNMALLAKQGWRLLTNPDAFWGRILK
ncbi:reverse transcriptase, partial [Tanacetum coccineum]